MELYCNLLEITSKYDVFRVSTKTSAIDNAQAGDMIYAEAGRTWVLDHTGRNQSTRDLETGRTLESFSYDAAGRLAGVTDRFGNALVVERDAGGWAAAIVAPDGQRTVLTHDEENRLVRVEYADGTDYQFIYEQAALMTAEIDPRGSRFEHEFDENGRVTTVRDPEGGSLTYGLAEVNGAWRLSETTAEGERTTYDGVENAYRFASTIVGPDGGTTEYERTDDGLRAHKKLACGTDMRYVYDLDPVGFYKYLTETRATTPAGRERVTLRKRTATDTDADTMPDRFVQTTTINGRVSTSITDTRTGMRVSTSAFQISPFSCTSG